MNTFKVNDVVNWSSQSNGHSKIKYGIIVEGVPAGQKPNHYYTNARKYESYVVKVPPKTWRDKHKFYWPPIQAN